MAQPSSRQKVLKRVKMGNGYRWSFGGKLIPETKAKRIKAARSLTGTKPRTKPRVAAGRAGGSTWVEPKTTTRRKKTGAQTWATQRRKVRTNARKRVGAKTLSAAHRRKISLALKRRYRSTKRVSPPKTRRKAVAKTTARRMPTRRRTNLSTRKPRYGTKAWYRYIGAKGARARKRGTKRNPASSPAKRRGTKRRSVKSNPPSHKKVSVRYSKTRYMERRTRGGPKVSHRVKRTGMRSLKTNKHSYRYAVVRKNPGLGDIGGLIKKVLPIYGGMIAARAIGQLVSVNVVQRYMVGVDKMIQPENVAYVRPLAPGLTFLLSVFVGPALVKGGGAGRQILEGLQLGSLVATFDALLSAFAPATAKPYLGVSGYDDMGVMGYGAYVRPLQGYMADPTGYSLPPAHATLEPGMGLDVHEAMALDSYVADDGLGLNVEEALADSESDYMQRGGAGGTLSRTVFTY